MKCAHAAREAASRASFLKLARELASTKSSLVAQKQVLRVLGVLVIGILVSLSGRVQLCWESFCFVSGCRMHAWEGSCAGGRSSRMKVLALGISWGRMCFARRTQTGPIFFILSAVSLLPLTSPPLPSPGDTKARLTKEAKRRHKDYRRHRRSVERDIRHNEARMASADAKKAVRVHTSWKSCCPAVARRWCSASEQTALARRSGKGVPVNDMGNHWRQRFDRHDQGAYRDSVGTFPAPRLS